MKKVRLLFAPEEYDIDESQYPVMSEEEYNKMCADSENMHVYDGRGTYDLYQCEGCDNHIITTYAAKGVTPFVIGCPKCGKAMMHTRTFDSIPEHVNIIKWVRPTYEQYCKMPIGVRDHISNGGLVMETDLINE